MTLPSVWPSYVRLLTTRRPALAPPGAPRVEAVLEARRVVPPAAALEAYRRVCGFPSSAGTLPVTYPHALANPLHLALVAGPAFPVRALGLVHLATRLRSLRPIPDRAPLDLRCAVEGPRETERGQEFELLTEVRLDGDGALAWSETALLLARKPGAGGGTKPGPPASAEPPAPTLARWELPADLGRRYAAASGDWNPIHLCAASARLFGFRRAIAHGMWSLARCVAELEPAGGTVALEAAFKLPVLLPATVSLHAAREGGATAFALKDRDGARPHVTGTIAAG